MAYSCRILADSVSPLGHRLTSFEIQFPRIVLAEFNTHRQLSRNSASSRAIPVAKQLRRILDDPFIPERFGKNQPGMQSSEFLDGAYHEKAKTIWLKGRDRAVLTALELLTGTELMEMNGKFLKTIIETIDFKNPNYLNVHKQITNRVLEPYMWHTVIATGTEWSNFFALRVHADAQPEIYTIAKMMLDTYETSVPTALGFGEWHLPLVEVEEKNEDQDWRKISAGRCARVSYLTHEGTRDTDADIKLYNRLVDGGHMSPTEHPARPMTEVEFDSDPWSGNFFGWHQHRKDIPNEHDFGIMKRRTKT